MLLSFNKASKGTQTATKLLEIQQKGQDKGPTQIRIHPHFVAECEFLSRQSLMTQIYILFQSSSHVKVSPPTSCGITLSTNAQEMGKITYHFF